MNFERLGGSKSLVSTLQRSISMVSHPNFMCGAVNQGKCRTRFSSVKRPDDHHPKLTNLDSNWLFQQTRLRAQEWATDSQVRSALETARNRDKVTICDRRLLLPDAGKYLCAANRFGRIWWGEALCAEFSAHFQLGPDHPYPDHRLYFATLTDIACSTPPDAEFVNIAGFKQQLREGLDGLSYLGMIESAFYTNIVRGASLPMKKGILWHAHLICWGESREKIKQRFEDMNCLPDNYRAIILGLAGADIRVIRQDGLPAVLGYMLKAPANAYRVYRTKHLTPAGTFAARFQQRKEPLRPGERITLFHLLKGLYLDQLAMAGGEGAEILRRAKRRALRDL